MTPRPTIFDRILACVHRDPGRRGLAVYPTDNLLTYTRDDFAAACRHIADHPAAALGIVTGFFIPTATPPAFETDGPLGALFLLRATRALNIPATVWTEPACGDVLRAALRHLGLPDDTVCTLDCTWDCRQRDENALTTTTGRRFGRPMSHWIAIERPGPAADGRAYSFRGMDITPYHADVRDLFTPPRAARPYVTIGIGDGGNEIGMGKIPPEVMQYNIPQAARIHCQLATDWLIVAGVSNWGAYALAGGLFAARGVRPPPELFEPQREYELLRLMVESGPLVDGIRGQPAVSVDGLSWEDYARALGEIGQLLHKL